jgi:hypothetical protein
MDVVGYDGGDHSLDQVTVDNTLDMKLNIRSEPILLAGSGARLTKLTLET